MGLVNKIKNVGHFGFVFTKHLTEIVFCKSCQKKYFERHPQIKSDALWIHYILLPGDAVDGLLYEQMQVGSCF